MEYLLNGKKYSVSYKNLKYRYRNAVELSDDAFRNNLPDLLHLACIIAWFKELPNDLTIGDGGIVHELVHLMAIEDDPVVDLVTIRNKFNLYLQLV